MKNSKFKRLLSLLLVMVILVSGSAFAVNAADEDETAETVEVPDNEVVDSDVAESEAADGDEEEPDSILDSVREMIISVLGDLRLVTLTDEAQEIALEDFDYLVEMILEVSPVQNIVERHLGMTMEDFLALARLEIVNKTPTPSFTYLYLGEDWIEAKEDPVDIAADYLFSLLTLVSNTLRGLGHLLAQDVFTVEQLFPSMVYITNNTEEMLEMGASQANLNMIQIQYDILSVPSTLKLYGLDPDEVDLEDASVLDEAGFMDENNLTPMIVEPDKIAYLHIASFMNNLDLDFGTLIPFFDEVQDYEHLIIDIRGNGGGFTNYFPLMMMLLLDESVAFEYPEFYLERELTAGYYEEPMSMMGGTLEGVYTAKEFVAERGMELFNEEDLEFLDSVLLWETGFEPIPDFNIPFEGDIWLLVDAGSASASVVAAMISANTGFATVVGETTSGVSGVTYTYAALPNTGILFRIDLGYTVDNYGRSYEEFGVIPQVINMPELDALDTVLTLIYAPDDVELKTPVYLDGENTDVSGVIFNGTTLIPVESVCDIFEAELTVDGWQVNLSYGDIEMTLNINSNEVYINDVSFEMLQPLQIVNGEIFIPIRFIAENFGFDVDYIDGNVVIISN